MSEQKEPQLTTLMEAQKFVESLGCGQSRGPDPTTWRITTPYEGIARRVVDAFKKAGIFMYPPRTDPPDNAKPYEGREPVESAFDDYPVMIELRAKLDPKKKPDRIFVIDVGWEYVQIGTTEATMPQLARAEPKQVKMAAEIGKE